MKMNLSTTTQENSSSPAPVIHRPLCPPCALITHLRLTSTAQTARPHSSVHFHSSHPGENCTSSLIRKYYLCTCDPRSFTSLLPRKYRPSPIFHTDECMALCVSDYCLCAYKFGSMNTCPGVSE